MSTASPIFELQGVGYRYPDGPQGLHDCSLRLARGRRHALLGANGAGKTTLLQQLNGLLRPSAGQIVFDGKPLDASRASLRALRQRVGLVFQNPEHQLFSAQVFEDVSFGPLNLGLDEATVRERVRAALADVGLSAQALAPVHQLSFGQKKRVCLAGVLAMQPEVLLLDEPMAGLDAPMQQALTALLDDLVGRGVTVLLSTHDIDFAYAWADHLHLMQAGRCTASLPAAELPAQAPAWRRAGQPLPRVLELHQALQQQGLVQQGAAPRSHEALLGLLQRPPLVKMTCHD
jgi:cobalt/nickel transport system ATP-binding protein